MGFHALTDFDEPRLADACATAGFPTEIRALEGKLSPGDHEDDDDWNARDLGLSPRPLQPQREGWSERVTVPKADIDLALDDDGRCQGERCPADRAARAALGLSAHGLSRPGNHRCEMADDRSWRHRRTACDQPASHQARPHESDDQVTDRSDPAPLTGEPVHWVQEKDSKAVRGGSL